MLNPQSNKEAMSLSPPQKRIIKRLVGPLFITPTPRWSETGDDTREELREQLISLLRDTQNNGIADVVEQNPQLCWPVLQEKVKSLRWCQRKGTFLS